MEGLVNCTSEGLGDVWIDIPANTGEAGMFSMYGPPVMYVETVGDHPIAGGRLGSCYDTRKIYI